MIRLYGFPRSLNVERVAIALAHKDLPTEVTAIDPADRTPVREISGQDLVPVIDDGGTIVHDSTAILRHLESRYPEEPLFPADPARRAEMDVFLDWFNRVWKRPPNVIAAELEKPAPDRALIDRMGAEITATLDLFEALLAGRHYLMGETLSAADCAAYPFLKYVDFQDPEDSHRFHQILREYETRGGDHRRLETWLGRMAGHPQVPV